MNSFIKYATLCAVASGLTSIAYASEDAGCGNEAAKEARMWRAFQIAQNNASKIHRALDDVMNASSSPSDPTYPSWEAGVAYVLSLQNDQNNMDIRIDTAVATNAAEFRANWGNATNPFHYRKRAEVDWFIGEYKEVREGADCLGRITAYSTGTNFNITNTPSSTPGFNNANYATDRFTVTLQEVKKAVGKDCNFNFRIVGIKQITESRFPLPPVPVPAQNLGTPVLFGVATSPIDPLVKNDPNMAVFAYTPCPA